MAMSVRERIKEIGVLRTLGFTTEKVLAMIVAEAVIIAMLGGLLGCVMAFRHGPSRWAAPSKCFSAPCECLRSCC
jgi:putative ABC transport system permease protein